MRDIRDLSKKEKEIKEIEETKKIKRLNQGNDLRKVLSSPEGKRTIVRLLKETGYLESSMTGNSNTFFNEGKREIGRFVFEEISEFVPEIAGDIFTEVFKKDIE